MRDLDLTASIIDIRDVIERYETLETDLEGLTGKDAGDFAGYEGWIQYAESQDIDPDLIEELKTLHSLLDELAGCGGDEEWRGDWYPTTLINEDYFVEYAEELVKDCGYIPHNLPHWIAIDWEKTADAVKEDYSLVTVGSNDYWYR